MGKGSYMQTQSTLQAKEWAYLTQVGSLPNSSQGPFSIPPRTLGG